MPSEAHRSALRTERVAVLGAGSWGTTMATMTAARVPTTLWSRRSELAEEIERHRENRPYLPGIELPSSLRVTASLAEALSGADVVVMAVPSHGAREVLVAAAGVLGKDPVVLSVTKGLEPGSRLRMSEVVTRVLPRSRVAVLTGPNLAPEVAAGQPAATVIAMEDAGIARELQRLLMTERFRVYTNADLVGCEIAGAAKNVLAIAAGMVGGLGMGESTMAAVVTRGLVELGRLVVALGGRQLTVASLAGVGDLVLTCTSAASRNRRVGVELGRGRPLPAVLAGMRMVAEGVRTARPLVELTAELGVEMPIAEQVLAVVGGQRSARAAMEALMRREAKDEFEGWPR